MTKQKHNNWTWDNSKILECLRNNNIHGLNQQDDGGDTALINSLNGVFNYQQYLIADYFSHGSLNNC
jgi:hypothetical protein